MEWKDKPRSTNVEDRRGQRRTGGGGFPGPINIPIGGGGSRGGLGGIGLILLVVFFLLRSGLLGGLLGNVFPDANPTNPYQQDTAPPVNTSTDDMGEFARGQPEVHRGCLEPVVPRKQPGHVSAAGHGAV